MSMPIAAPSLSDILDAATPVTRSQGDGPAGALPLTEELLRNAGSGDLFGLTQNAGMGWDPAEVTRPQYLILSTQGGLRAEDGQPLALGYHTGHWEVILLVRAAAETLRAQGGLPFAAHCSDPCDGRTQGTAGMMDSLPYRNDAAIVLRRLIRSLPLRKGVLGVATCDKGLPAMLLALAGSSWLPGVIVPGGVTLPARDAEDAGTVQTIGARFAHGLITMEYAATMGCRACGSPGGGCQFSGHGRQRPGGRRSARHGVCHTARCRPPASPSGWTWRGARRWPCLRQESLGLTLADILTPAALEKRHAGARGISVAPPTCCCTSRPSRMPPACPRPASLTGRASIAARRAWWTPCPTAPRNHPTVQVFLAGGVPEVMLQLRALGLLDCTALTVTGASLGELLDWWQTSERRDSLRQQLRVRDGIDPDDVILSPDSARSRGMTSTVVFPVGNLAPEGSVVKATAIDKELVDEDEIYRPLRSGARVHLRARSHHRHQGSR